MIVECLICNNRFELNSVPKLLNVIPKVCSVNCFLKYLNLIKLDSFDKFIKIVKMNSFCIEEHILEEPFKSKIERNFAKLFDELKIKWQYEKFTFYSDKLKTYDYQPVLKRHYTPDFFLPEYNVLVEIKHTSSVNNKSIILAEYLPLIVLDINMYNILKRGINGKQDITDIT
jgi:hypothetical protein